MTRRPTRYYHDHEFLEDGHTIDLISTGIVCEDGRTYYAVSAEVDMQAVAAHDFLPGNVVPYLPTYYDRRKGYRKLDLTHPDVKPRAQIAEEVRAFLLGDGRGSSRSERELWAWYAAYDHVTLCQLWGPMSRLPEGIPMFTRDIKSEAVRLGDPPMPAQDAKEHHALADAEHNRLMHAYLEELEDLRLSRAAGGSVGASR